MTEWGHDKYGPPQVADVVIVDGVNYIVREIDYTTTQDWVKVSAGRTDSGMWVVAHRCTVVYRDSMDREKDDA